MDGTKDQFHLFAKVLLNLGIVHSLKSLNLEGGIETDKATFENLYPLLLGLAVCDIQLVDDTFMELIPRLPPMQIHTHPSWSRMWVFRQS